MQRRAVPKMSSTQGRGNSTRLRCVFWLDIVSTFIHVAQDEAAAKFEAQRKRLQEAKEQAAKDARAEGRSIGEDLEAKYDAAKDVTTGGLNRARDSTEHYYNEARSAVDQKTTEALHDIDKKTEQAKSGWANWFGWGKSSVQNGVHTAESEADRLKREAAEKVAKAAEGVHVRAERHA